MDVIVVASSEHSIQESFRVLLGGDNMVVPARTLSQLLNAVNEKPVDIVIIDEFLENHDCVSVFRKMRAVSSEMTCILIALQANSDIARQMQSEGIYDVIGKPFDKDSVISSVGRALERARLVKKLAATAQAPVRSVAPPTPNGESALTQRRETLDSLRKLLKAVADVSEPERLYALVLDVVVDMFAINRAALLLWDEIAQQAKIVAAVGLDPTELNGYEISPWSATMSWLRLNDRVLTVDDPDLQGYSDEVLSINKELTLLQARMCVPLATKGRLIGMFAIGKKVTNREFTDPEVEFLYLLSQQIAIIIENAWRHHDMFVLKERFNEILQGVNSGLMATDSQGNLIVFNNAAGQILGLKPEDVLGQSIQRAGSVFADIVFRTLREGKSFRREEVVDPATRTLLGLSTTLLTDSEGTPVGAVILFTDLSTVTGQVAATSDETWQECSLRMAHEIKTPLTSIRTFTQLFPESYADEKFRNEFSQIALREIDRLDGVVERLLRYAQPLEIHAEPGDINALLEEGIEEVAEIAKSQKVELKKELGAINGDLLFDRGLMKEAMEQIINNALEAMPAGGALTVSTKVTRYPDSDPLSKGNGAPSGPVAEISISDTGAGIKPDEVSEVFRPFHTNKPKGMGLGLSISQRIIRGHNGDLLISSEPDKGTVVKVILPYGAA